jgi:hypothetical protein
VGDVVEIIEQRLFAVGFLKEIGVNASLLDEQSQIGASRNE